MIETFRRLRLQKKGLSCGKKRREREVGSFQEFLRCSPAVAGMILGFSGLFLGWLVLYRPGLGAPHVDEPLRLVFVMMVVFLGATLQFSSSQPGSFQRNSRLLVVMVFLCLEVGLIKALVALVEDHFLATRYKLLLAPVALAPIALTILFGRGHGIFAAMFGALWGALLMPQTRLLPWLVTSLLMGLVAVAASREVRRRKEVLRVGFFVGITACVLAIIFDQLRWVQSPAVAHPQNWRTLTADGLIVIGWNIVVGVVVSSLLPLIESTFRITTASSWVEMGALNHPLLRRMTIEAPGTYHHSLMVANLAEAAAATVGADTLATRVCPYFHDIGKLKNPEYFIENQPADDNPHDSMTPSMSALVVISHVKDGIDIGLRHKLNPEIIDVIEQHHGTSLAWYFYQRALTKQKEMRALADEDKAHETDVPDVDERSFRYPGPKPQSRECAIISLADSIESASRTLEKPTPAKIEQLVEDIVRNRIMDGQLDECRLTFGELEIIKKSFVTTLRSMLHKRVAYSKEERGDKDGKGTTTATSAGTKTTRFEVIRGKGSDSKGGRAA